MVTIIQSTIERLLYVLLVIMFIAQIVTYMTLVNDDNKKFHVLKSNQAQIFCVIKAPPTLATATRSQQLQFIDDCIRNNQ